MAKTYNQNRRKNDTCREYEIDKIVAKISDKVNQGFLKDGVLDLEVIEFTQEFAKELRKLNISSSSVRSIYDSFKNQQLKLQREYIRLIYEGDIKGAGEKAFSKILPMVKLMKSKANYVLERKQRDTKNEGEKKGYEALNEFISIFVNAIRERDQFDGFMDLFECVLGNLKAEKK